MMLLEQLFIENCTFFFCFNLYKFINLVSTIIVHRKNSGINSGLKNWKKRDRII